PIEDWCAPRCLTSPTSPYKISSRTLRVFDTSLSTQCKACHIHALWHLRNQFPNHALPQRRHTIWPGNYGRNPPDSSDRYSAPACFHPDVLTDGEMQRLRVQGSGI